MLTSKLARNYNDICEATSLLVFLWARTTICVVIILCKSKKSLTLGFNFLNSAKRKQFYPTGIVSMPFYLSRVSWLWELGGRFSTKGAGTVSLLFTPGLHCQSVKVCVFYCYLHCTEEIQTVFNRQSVPSFELALRTHFASMWPSIPVSKVSGLVLVYNWNNSDSKTSVYLLLLKSCGNFHWPM